MSNPQALFSQAFQAHNAGRHDEADALYDALLAIDPGCADALHLKGVLAYQRGDATGAVTMIRQALNHHDREPNYHQNLALALRALGRFDEAASHYGAIIALEPRRADAYFGLGATHAARGDAERAAACWRAALGVDRDHAGALVNLISMARDSGDTGEAIALLRGAWGRRPERAEHAINLGMLARQSGDLDMARAVYRRLLALDPALTAGHYGMGDTLARGDDLDGARAAFRRAILCDPTQVEAHDGMARLLERELRYADARLHFQRFIAIRPQDPRAWLNLGMVLENGGDMPAAVPRYTRATRIDPGFTLGWSKIIHKLTLCDWSTYAEDEAAILRLIRQGGGHIPAIPLVYMASTPADQRLSAERQIDVIERPKVADLAHVRFPHVPGPRDKLTIGYVSGDFREHAVAFLIAEALELHDRRRFTIIGYSNGPDRGEQPTRKRLEAAVDQMVNIRDLSTLEAARRVHADGVDILVDLSGHTLHSRFDMLALRPAPVQVTWLGYPGTTGADFIDHILVDPIVAPADQQPHYSERLVHLPHCYQPNDRKRPVSPHTPSRGDCGLPETGFVFCSFNHAPKITPTAFSAWMRILDAVPGSVLWLLEAGPIATANLRQEAAARGIDPDRLIFAPRLALPYHLARFRVADLFLDTFPYNAHTTASDALWVGCPLLTILGDTFPGRVAASLLINIGLPELITASVEAYERKAVELANDPDQLRDHRQRLEANRDTCPLFDTARLTRDLENTYIGMWNTYVENADGGPAR